MAADPTALKQDLTRRMDSALETLRREFSGLRSGRASPALLEPVRVEAYGSEMPLPQVGTIAVPEARMITVQVWDRALVNAVVAAIRDCGLGLNPAADGQLVRVPLPQLTGERRDGREQVKALEKKSTISQDDATRWHDEVQKLTDSYVKRVDDLLAEKDKEIKQV
jgi:ribosome recycling factor